MEMNETNELNREMDSFRIPTGKYYDTSLEDVRSSFQKSSVMLADESIVELAKASVGEGKNGIVAKIGDSYYLYKDKEIKKITEEEANKNGYKIVDTIGVEINWNEAANEIKAYLNRNKLRMPSESNNETEEEKNDNEKLFRIFARNLISTGTRVDRIFSALQDLQSQYNNQRELVSKLFSEEILKYVQEQKEKYLEKNKDKKISNDYKEIEPLHKIGYNSSWDFIFKKYA